MITKDGSNNMKKKLLVLIIVLNSITLLSANSPKWYSDPVNQYEGLAAATYASSDDTLNLNNVHEIARKVSGIDMTCYQGPYKKISKEDSFLILSALGEWDYSIGEIYNVIVYYKSGITLFVTVRIKKEKFDYVASCFKLASIR